MNAQARPPPMLKSSHGNRQRKPPHGEAEFGERNGRDDGPGHARPAPEPDLQLFGLEAQELLVAIAVHVEGGHGGILVAVPEENGGPEGLRLLHEEVGPSHEDVLRSVAVQVDDSRDFLVGEARKVCDEGGRAQGKHASRTLPEDDLDPAFARTPEEVLDRVAVQIRDGMMGDG